MKNEDFVLEEVELIPATEFFCPNCSTQNYLPYKVVESFPQSYLLRTKRNVCAYCGFDCVRFSEGYVWQCHDCSTNHFLSPEAANPDLLRDMGLSSELEAVIMPKVLICRPCGSKFKPVPYNDSEEKD